MPEQKIVKYAPWGNLGNQMLRYILASYLGQKVDNLNINTIDIPEWGIASQYDGPWPRARDCVVIDRTFFNFETTIDALKSDQNQGVFIRTAPCRAVEYGEYIDLFRASFPLNMTDATGYDESHLVINIRSGEILEGVNRLYSVLPIKFYETLIKGTRLTPVFMGQTNGNVYTDLLRNVFGADALFLESQGALKDFETIRKSKNIVISLSTFSWLAAWLSESAERIYFPIGGLYHPLYGLGLDFMPVFDRRYHFYEFPRPSELSFVDGYWALLTPDSTFSEISRDRAGQIRTEGLQLVQRRERRLRLRG